MSTPTLDAEDTPGGRLTDAERLLRRLANMRVRRACMWCGAWFSAPAFSPQSMCSGPCLVESEEDRRLRGRPQRTAIPLRIKAAS